MLYGYATKIKNEPVTVVGAADTVEEFELWYDSVAIPQKDVKPKHKSHRATTFLDHLQDPEFKGYKHPVYVFIHESDDELEKFQSFNQLFTLQPQQLRDKHIDMLAAKEEDLKTNFNLKDKRTIGEISELTPENDRWDRRTQEERDADASNTKKTDELRKRLGDHVTGQSFDPNPRSGTEDDDFNIRGVHVHKDGSIHVNASKGVTQAGGPEKPVEEQTNDLDNPFDDVEVEAEIPNANEKYLFHAFELENNDVMSNEPVTGVIVCLQSDWEENKDESPVSHTERLRELKLIDSSFEELGVNSYAVFGKTTEQLKNELLAKGMIENQEYSSELSEVIEEERKRAYKHPMSDGSTQTEGMLDSIANILGNLGVNGAEIANSDGTTTPIIKMPKIGFTRQFAIFTLESFLDDEAEEKDYNSMTDEELAIELCLDGIISNENLGGIFDEVPENLRDAEKIYRNTKSLNFN